MSNASIVRRPASKLLSFIARTLDPAAVTERVQVYTKAVAGVVQLFARVGDGTIYQITPALRSELLLFGNGGIQSGADTRYLSPYYAQAAAEVTPIDLVVPRAGTIRNLYVLHNMPVGDGDPVDYALMKNSVPTALVATLASNAAGPATDLVNSVSVAAGDKIGFRAVKAVGITDGALFVVATMDFEPA